MSREQHTTEAVTVLSQRRARVAEMALQKIPVAEIARKLRISPKIAYDDLARVRELWRQEAVGDLAPRIGEQLATIEQLKSKLQELLRIEERTDPLLRVVGRLLDVMEREAKLLGLDAPDELRLDVSTIHEVIAHVMRAVIPFVQEPAARVALANEIDGIVARYAGGTWSQERASSSNAG